MSDGSAHVGTNKALPRRCYRGCHTRRWLLHRPARRPARTHRASRGIAISGRRSSRDSALEGLGHSFRSHHQSDVHGRRYRRRSRGPLPSLHLDPQARQLGGRDRRSDRGRSGAHDRRQRSQALGRLPRTARTSPRPRISSPAEPAFATLQPRAFFVPRARTARATSYIRIGSGATVFEAYIGGPICRISRYNRRSHPCARRGQSEPRCLRPHSSRSGVDSPQHGLRGPHAGSSRHPAQTVREVASLPRNSLAERMLHLHGSVLSDGVREGLRFEDGTAPSASASP
jgi:hypothetical protein